MRFVVAVKVRQLVCGRLIDVAAWSAVGGWLVGWNGRQRRVIERGIEVGDVTEESGWCQANWDRIEKRTQNNYKDEYNIYIYEYSRDRGETVLMGTKFYRDTFVNRDRES